MRGLQVLNLETGDIIVKILNNDQNLSYNPVSQSIHPIFTDPKTLKTELFVIRNYRGLFLVDLGSENDSTNFQLNKKKKQPFMH
jgi:hypothetical protein